jgi:hypothetical protein
MCVTKETNPPFVFALAAICVVGRRNGSATQRRHQLYAIAIGTGAGVILNAAFNVFRFGTIRNTAYARPGLQTANTHVIARFFAAQWLAPNGGLVWFWPLALALIIGTAALSMRRTPISVGQVGPPLVALLLIGQILVLSTWWTPFGWYAWGPRLILPLLPAMIVVSCVVAAPHVTQRVSRLLTSRAFVPVAVVAIAIGLPQAAAGFHGLAVSEFFAPVPNFCTAGGLTQAPMSYYHCLVKTAWSKQPWMLALGLKGLQTSQGRIVAVAFVGAMSLLLYTARRTALQRSNADTPQHPSLNTGATSDVRDAADHIFGASRASAQHLPE